MAIVPAEFETAREVLTDLGAIDSVDEIEVWPEPLERLEDQELVAFVQAAGTLNLNAAALGLGIANIAYEPAHFPGVIYWRSDPDAVLLLFSDGHIICVDAASVEQARIAIEATADELKEVSMMEPPTIDTDDIETVAP